MMKKNKHRLKLQRRKGTKHLSKEDSLAKTLRRSQALPEENDTVSFSLRPSV